MNMKIKVRCFKVLLWTKKIFITIALKFVVCKFKRTHALLMGIWISTTSDRIKRWIFENIKRTVLDHNNCFSYFLLFWSNLFNYFSLSSIFGEFQIYGFIFCRHDLNNEGIILVFTKATRFFRRILSNIIERFLIRKPSLCLSLSFLNIMLEIRPRFS